MASTPVDIVLAWLDAVNAGDAEAALERTAPDVAIIGPHGTGHGREVLRGWLEHAGATFETLAVYAGRDAAVVAQRGTWRDASSGTVRGEATVATRFLVADAHVAEIQRYEDLAAALRDAGLTAADARPYAPRVAADGRSE